MHKNIIAESLGLSVPTINYESVNGFKILGSDKVIEIPISVLDLFRCPISRDIMKVPTMVCESGQFYDYEHIEKWIKIKRSDPITNIILNENGVNYICCINYLAFLLCLEKLNDKLYFHLPYGNLYAFLRTIFHMHKKSSIKSITRLNLGAKITFPKCIEEYDYCLDIRAYLPYVKYIGRYDGDVLANVQSHPLIVTTQPTYSYITLEEILFTCPISYRNMYQNCDLIFGDGIFVHNKTLPIYGKFIEKYGGQASCVIELKSNYRVHNDDLYKMFKRNIVDTNFTVVDKKHEPSTIPYGQQFKLHYIAHDTTNLDSHVSDIVEYSHYEDKNVDTWNHFSLWQNQKEIYEQYRNSYVNPYQAIQLSEYVSKGTGFYNVYDLRKGYGLPCFADPFYGVDWSLLDVKKSVVRQENMYRVKAFFCVGTKFTDCEFHNVDFNYSCFIGASFKNTRFVNCEFTSCEVYMADARFVGKMNDEKNPYCITFVLDNVLFE